MNSITDQRTSKGRREDDFHLEAARVPLRLVVAVALFVAGLLTTYYASVNAVNARVAVLESEQETTKRSLDRIEVKVDRLIDLRMRDLRAREQ